MFESDDYYMNCALAEAEKALALDEVPIGAVIVDSTGVIIGRGYNAVEKYKSQQGHAELRALAEATETVGGWRLDGCRIYITLEPCMMCLGGLLLSRISWIAYGARSSLFGSTHLLPQLLEGYKKNVSLFGGLQAGRCSDILGAFFEKARTEQEVRRKNGCEIHRNTEESIDCPES